MILKASIACAIVFAVVFYIAFALTQQSFLLFLVMLAIILCIPAIALVWWA